MFYKKDVDSRLFIRNLQFVHLTHVCREDVLHFSRHGLHPIIIYFFVI